MQKVDLSNGREPSQYDTDAEFDFIIVICIGGGGDVGTTTLVRIGFVLCAMFLCPQNIASFPIWSSQRQRFSTQELKISVAGRESGLMTSRVFYSLAMFSFRTCIHADWFCNSFQASFQI